MEGRCLELFFYPLRRNKKWHKMENNKEKNIHADVRQGLNPSPSPLSDFVRILADPPPPFLPDVLCERPLRDLRVRNQVMYIMKISYFHLALVGVRKHV